MYWVTYFFYFKLLSQPQYFLLWIFTVYKKEKKKGLWKISPRATSFPGLLTAINKFAWTHRLGEERLWPNQFFSRFWLVDRLVISSGRQFLCAKSKTKVYSKYLYIICQWYLLILPSTHMDKDKIKKQIPKFFWGGLLEGGAYKRGVHINWIYKMVSFEHFFSDMKTKMTWKNITKRQSSN